MPPVYPPLYALAFCQPHEQTVQTMRSELWQRLRQARRYADLTQQDLADKCGVTRGAVALWEAAEPEHRTKPTVDNLVKMAEACGVPLEWLLNDAADLNAIWRMTGEFGDPKPRNGNHNGNHRGPVQDVIPDLRQGGHLFLFAQTGEQIAAKLKQLSAEEPGVTKHLILIGSGSANVQLAATPSDALALAVKTLANP